MEKRKYSNSIIAFFAAIMLVWPVSCTRDTEDLELAKYPSIPEVFIDGFSAGLNYAAFGGSKVTAFDVDNEVRYSGSASMKIEIPDAGDPQGSYAGGVYFTSMARDLSAFDAITFWAKASKDATVDLVGFGNDLGESKYLVSLGGMKVNSNWKKYIIPIPDASKLTAEKGMFYYSEGPEDGTGYTLWFDEVKFEKLGTIAHKRPLILDGNEVSESAVNGLSLALSGLSMVFNMPDGIDQVFQVAPAWFSFASSDPAVAEVDSKGTIKVLAEGTTKITATSGGTEATGSMTVTSAGEFIHAPVPSQAAGDVISIFSNAYTNVPVDFYNGYWEPYQTTRSADFKVNNDDVLYYTNFNFVGIQFTTPPVNASEMTRLHMDVWIPNAVAPGDKLSVKLVDMGPDGSLNGTDPSVSFEIPGPLASKTWISADFSLAGLASRSKLAQIILEKLGTGPTGFYLDNVYFYKGGGPVAGPTVAAPEPPSRNASDVVSLFSGAYTNLSGTDLNPNWGQSTVVTTEDIAGNATLKYANFNYQGTVLSSQQDLTGMQFLHVDMWTADATAVGVTPINASGSPAENLVSLTPIVAGQWNSYDIPLSSFTSSGMSLNQVFQMKFDGQAGTNPSNIYLDNIYFYKTGGGATAPTAGAPEPPSRNAADVVSLFSGAYTSLSGTDFNPNWGQSTVVTTEDIAGNSTLKYANFNYQGTVLSSQQDLSGMQFLHVDMWTADATVVGVTPINASGSPQESLVSLTPIVAGQWNSYDIPLTSFTSSGMSLNQVFQMKFDGQAGTNPSNIYLDNIYFYRTGGAATEPTAAAPGPPARNAADVISLFSNAYSDVTVNTWRTDWSAAILEEVSIAGNAAKKYSALDFVGIETNPNMIDATGMSHVHIDVWSADFTKFGIKLVDFGANAAYGGGDDVEHQIEYTTPAKGVWVSYDIPLNNFTGLTTRAHLAQYILVGQPSGATTIWIDNFYFYKTGGGQTGGPTVAAPTPPARNAADVISFFSNAYANVTVDSWSAEWDDSNVEDLTVAGDAVKKYTFTNFAGIDFSAHKLNASAMTRFHMDIWTPDDIVPGDVLTIKGVDFGGGTGEVSSFILTVVHTVNGSIPALEKGKWISFDLPLTAFTGTLTRSDFAQIVLTCTMNNLYIDNLYLYK